MLRIDRKLRLGNRAVGWRIPEAGCLWVCRIEPESDRISGCTYETTCTSTKNVAMIQPSLARLIAKGRRYASVLLRVR